MSNGDKHYIYALEDPISKRIRYVGQSSNPHARYNCHVSRASLKEDNSKKKAEWILSLLDRGLKPNLLIIEETTKKDAIGDEMFWVSLFRSWGFCLTNLTKYEKSKILSKAKQGINLSEDHKTNISKALSGRAKDYECVVPDPSKKVALYNHGEKINDFDSMKQAAEHYDISATTISNNVNGYSKTTKHGIWRLV